jgi:hypothetical protein
MAAIKGPRLSNLKLVDGSAGRCQSTSSHGTRRCFAQPAEEQRIKIRKQWRTVRKIKKKADSGVQNCISIAKLNGQPQALSHKKVVQLRQENATVNPGPRSVGFSNVRFFKHWRYQIRIYCR